MKKELSWVNKLLTLSPEEKLKVLGGEGHFTVKAKDIHSAADSILRKKRILASQNAGEHKTSLGRRRTVALGPLAKPQIGRTRRSH